MNTDSHVYEAQRVIYEPQIGVTFSDVKLASAFLRHIQGSSWFISRFPQTAATKISLKRNDRWNYAYSTVAKAKIVLPLWAMTSPLVCHELAHFCQFEVGEVDAMHGPAFCGIQAALISRFVDKNTGRRLIWAYKAWNVEYERW